MLLYPFCKKRNGGSSQVKVNDLLVGTHAQRIKHQRIKHQRIKHLSAMQQTQVQSLGWEDLLEKETATHSSILAWRIPRTEEPGGLQSMGSHRVGHDRSDLAHTHGGSRLQQAPGGPLESKDIQTMGGAWPCGRVRMSHKCC